VHSSFLLPSFLQLDSFVKDVPERSFVFFIVAFAIPFFFVWDPEF